MSQLQGKRGSTRSGWRVRWVPLLALLLAGTACEPTGSRPGEEERDPSFLAGKSGKLTKDYQGAVDAFQRALRNNPKSASAHFELGLLFYENLSDYAAAIYHFERFLRLQPHSNRRDAIEQLIKFSKVELAKDVPLGSIPQQMQRELDRLTQTNKALQLEVETLRIELAQRTPASAGPAPVPAPPADPLAAGSTPVASNTIPVPSPSPTARPEPDRRSATVRTHTVRKGDTLFSIAARHGTTVGAIQSANPGVDPKRLRIGQVLKLP